MSSHILKIPLTPAEREAIVKMASLQRFEDNRTRFKPLDQTLVIGKAGEWAFKKQFPESLWVDAFTHDFVWNGWMIDVNSMRMSQAKEPGEYFMAATPAIQTKHADIFVWAFVPDSLEAVWLAGWINGKDLIEHGVLKKRGEPQPVNSIPYRTDTWEIAIKRLNSMQSLATLEPNASANTGTFFVRPRAVQGQLRSDTPTV